MTRIETNGKFTKGATFTWDRKRVKRFKVELDKAKENGAVEFTFDGHEFVTSYANYLYEYVDGQLRK